MSAPRREEHGLVTACSCEGRRRVNAPDLPAACAPAPWWPGGAARRWSRGCRASAAASLVPLLVTAVAAAAAACTGEGGRGEGPEVVKAYGLEVERARLGNRLHLFTFSDYLDPALARVFEATYGVRVIQDYYDNNEALIAKLQAGGVGQYDLVIVSDYALSILIRLGLVEPLEKAWLPNLANADSVFLDREFDPGNRYSVPYQWGVTGIGIRTDLVDTAGADLHTWAILFDPARQLGTFTMLDDARETIGAALKYLGYSLNTTEPSQLEAAERLLLEQRRRVLAYASFSTARDYLIFGDAAIVHNFSGDIAMAQGERQEIAFVVPREGSTIWIDNLAIPARAPHRPAAHVFMNFILDAENGARLSEFTRYASPNRAAYAHLSWQLRETAERYLDPAIIGKMEFLRDLGEARALYDRVWTRVRVGAGRL